MPSQLEQDTLGNSSRIAVLEKDVINFSLLHEKLSNVIEKLSDVIGDLKESIVKHDIRLSSYEKKEEKIEEWKERVETRLDALEQWRWYLFGAFAAFTIGWMIINSKFFKFN
jgi:hypothetical protein